MSRSSRLPLGPRTFLLTGIPYGLWAAWYFPAPSLAVSVAVGVSAGLLFGGMMSVSMTLLASWRGAGPERAEPRQERTLRLHASPEALHAAARQALLELGVTRRTVDDVEAGVLEGSTPMTWWSFGTVVTVSIGAPVDGVCKVLLRTAPRLPTQVIDYGAAAGVLDAVEGALIDGSAVPEAQPEAAAVRSVAPVGSAQSSRQPTGSSM